MAGLLGDGSVGEGIVGFGGLTPEGVGGFGGEEGDVLPPFDPPPLDESFEGTHHC